MKIASDVDIALQCWTTAQADRSTGSSRDANRAMKRLVRYISIFNIHNDEHIGDIHFIITPDLARLQEAFNMPGNNPMHDEYTIDASIATSLPPTWPKSWT